MVWIAPTVDRADGPLVAAEAELSASVLDWHRATLLVKCAGLTGAQLARTPVAPSNLSLLGLIRHMAKVERVWFRRRLRGEPVEMLYSTPDRPDADFEDLDPARAEEDYTRLVAEQAEARRAASGLPLDTTLPTRDGAEMSLRMLYHHMIGEYARHNGHADLIRQSVDGATGG